MQALAAQGYGSLQEVRAKYGAAADDEVEGLISCKIDGCISNLNKSGQKAKRMAGVLAAQRCPPRASGNV